MLLDRRYWRLRGHSACLTPGGSEAVCQAVVTLERIFCVFFRFWIPGVVGSRSRGLTCLPSDGADPLWLHHALLEVLSPPKRRLQQSLSLGAATEQRIGAILPSSATIRRTVSRGPGSARRG